LALMRKKGQPSEHALPSPSGRRAGGEGRSQAGHSTWTRISPRSFLRKAAVEPALLDLARRLRGEMTQPDQLIWGLVRNRQLDGFKFRRQHSVGPYVADFYCDEAKLAIELDGGQHNTNENRQRDSRRTRFFSDKGIRVIRFWNNEVLEETEAVLEGIWWAAINGAAANRERPSPPASLPEGEGR
jgi:very-short-patch-repair endonuclease